MQSKEEIFESTAPRRITDGHHLVPPHGWTAQKPKNRAEILREAAESKVNGIVNSFMKAFDMQSQEVAMEGQRRLSITFECPTDAIKNAITHKLKNEGLNVDASYTSATGKYVKFSIGW